MNRVAELQGSKSLSHGGEPPSVRHQRSACRWNVLSANVHCRATRNATSIHACMPRAPCTHACTYTHRHTHACTYTNKHTVCVCVCTYLPPACVCTYFTVACWSRTSCMHVKRASFFVLLCVMLLVMLYAGGTRVPPNGAAAIRREIFQDRVSVHGLHFPR